ncbi:protein KIAA0100-like [Gigantopelta aegis]|uniref:protein KIAA0100-like n=1 Tax=Gigantopelta aegis TaxID=1735272 RepID=UPI001B8897C5|nr:protein KIAA0100-like [Gigantopelta aegis]
MLNYFLTLLIFVFGIWIVSRMFAWLICLALQRFLDVQIKFGSFGLFNFGNVQVIIKGMKIEVSKVWVSSCFVNTDVRKLIILCVRDVRIQADVSPTPDTARPYSEKTKRSTIPTSDIETTKKDFTKIMAIAQVLGIRIENLTVMILNKVIPFCLIHIAVQEISAEGGSEKDNFLFSATLNGLSCKALRSIDGESDSSSPRCLGELSVSLSADVTTDKADPSKLRKIKLLVTKPQMMITEGFLQNLQNIHSKLAVSTMDVDSSVVKEPSKKFDIKKFEHLQELKIDFTKLNLKILRETKHRSLSISMKLFHVGLTNRTSEDYSPDIACSVMLEEFYTSSPQAQFAGLTKLHVKSKLLGGGIDVKISSVGGFFQYHHEEVQYWVLVFKNIGLGQTRSSKLVETKPDQPKDSPIFSYLEDKKLSVVILLTNMTSMISMATCSGFHLGLQRCKLTSVVNPGMKGWLSSKSVDEEVIISPDISIELEIDGVHVSHADTKVSVLSQDKHYWDHVLYMGLLLLKIKKRDGVLNVDALTDNLQLEWSTSTMNVLLSLTGAMSKTQLPHKTQPPPPDPVAPTAPAAPTAVLAKPSWIKRYAAVVKWDISSLNVFLCNNHKVCLMLRVDKILIDHKDSHSSLTVDGAKVIYMNQTNTEFKLLPSAKLSDPVVHIKEIRVKFQDQSLQIYVQKELVLVWATHCHMCLNQAIQDALLLRGSLKRKLEEGREATPPVENPVSSGEKQKLSVDVLIKAETHLALRLSKDHSISMSTHCIVLTATLPHVAADIKHFVVKFDEHKIFRIKGMVAETLSPNTLIVERKTAGNLKLETNRAWGFSFDHFQVVFPFEHSFALCFEELVNFIKWLKLVHHIKKKEFTVDSKLPPDLKIKTKTFSVQLSDDTFEVKIGDNYELLKDEGEQNETRKLLLDKKIDEKHQQYGHIPIRKREELYLSLAKRSAEVYIQRSQKLYSSMPMRTKLFTWLMEDLQIIALADRSYHGKENVVKHMKEIDSDSLYPVDGLEFSTLWCRTVNVSINSWVVTLRDYPQPMLDVQNMLLWGRLIGAEQEASKRAKRSCVVEVEQPWGDVTVERSLPPLKFFHDFSCDIANFTMAYGVCWEPAVALFNSSMDLINKPSTDPSCPLPFWDKVRLLFHGRLTMSIEKMSWQYHASFDPYNTTELMDWIWSNVIVDWTNAKWVLKGDLDIHARTASKYDDCKLFHFPNLRFCIRLEWLCLGDPNDHHAVMPCAPDKVPDYSMEKHDSFRAFRSENLNLDVSLDIKASKGMDIPSCKLYASSLRFMKKIQNCMFSVTRPVRRGKLFNNTTPRKPQLTRHYKKIKLHVNFHQFSIWYWMSFSNPHGAELLSESFVMHMCNKLTLEPIEDGLCHRPRSDWSIKYLTCELGTTKTWLCKFGDEVNEDMMKDLRRSIRNPLDKSFFMSIARISYQRADNSKESEMKKLNSSDSDVYVHSVKIYDMKGAWTKKNRSVVIALYEGFQKNNTLRRNLSSKALKGFKVEGGTRSRNASTCYSPVTGHSTTSVSVATPSPASKIESGHAMAMLMKLVSESNSKSVAFTEEPSGSYIDQLHGVQACHTGEILLKNWFICLHNSQVLLKGSETNGYVIVSCHKANIQSTVRHPIWCDSQLRSKNTWEADVNCMQYYATVDPRQTFDDDDIPWLSKHDVELQTDHDHSSVNEMSSSGYQVGGIVNVKTGEKSVQLQRIIARCRCQVFYASYGEVENNTMPLLPAAEETDMMKVEEGVDTVTLLHHDLMMSSNTLQYTVILDIVNNLLLYIEPKEKEANEKLQSMRFHLLLSRVEDQKTPILELQETVREHVQRLRRLERELYLVNKTLDECYEDDDLTERCDLLEAEVNSCKEYIFKQNEELTMRISCYKESQLQVSAQMKTERSNQSNVVRLNEVCFMFANWRLTDKDGQIGITDISLRNFLYSKTNRDDATWTHQLEVGWFKVENLLRNTIYRDVLEPCDAIGKDGRVMALRIFCSERPPVGGIAVKEHFEVNVVPLNIQMTYQFYEAVMGFFFPDKNIEADDQDDDVEASKKKAKKGKGLTMKKIGTSDDIDKMKERAANNNSFLYIKVPEVTLRVSYKGQKDKNILDVHDFSFVLPTAEYHNQIWTWFDFLIALKNHSKTTLVSQAIKQKLRMKTRVTDEQVLTDVQKEEDKAKMLLGAKVLAGQDKPGTKKGLFGKSSKP